MFPGMCYFEVKRMMSSDITELDWGLDLIRIPVLVAWWAVDCPDGTTVAGRHYSWRDLPTIWIDLRDVFVLGSA